MLDQNHRIRYYLMYRNVGLVLWFYKLHQTVSLEGEYAWVNFQIHGLHFKHILWLLKSLSLKKYVGLADKDNIFIPLYLENKC